MQLTRLEIKGFKSFGDKVVINFDEGITSIVGPNGCGKSNVVDAIRWVLGEQSTKVLRSEKMDNIIFNGTNTRKAAHLAEVSLSFKNTKNILPTDFSQVTITRKLYRNGDSEYRLNDVQCRLKDINDLFLNTGIGSDSYAIIELRMVEEIINNKDHSRRSLFEEASGISKYKVRKRQTLSRLNETQSNLNRVEDIVHEIEKNLNSLEKQAKKTERYHKLKERYKEQSLKLSSFKVNRISKLVNETEQKIGDEEKRSVVITSMLSTKEAHVENMKQEIITKEKNLSLQQKSLNQRIEAINRWETEKKVKKEQFNNLKSQREQITLEIERSKKTKNDIEFELKRLREEELLASDNSSDQKILLDRQFDIISSLKKELAIQKEQLDQSTKSKQLLLNSIYEIEKQVTINNVQSEALKRERERIELDEQHQENEIDTLNKTLANLNSKMSSTEKDFQTALEAEEELERQIQLKQQELELLKKETQKNLRVLDAKQNEYTLMQAMVDNLKGFPDSVRFLKKNTDWSKDAPLLSDIFQCQDKYRVAVENFLEPYMNYYVVDTFEEAIAAIHLLDESGKGKAGFFIMDALPKYIEKEREYKHLLPVLSVIEVEEKYKPLCKHIFDSVFINEEHEIYPKQHSSLEDIIVLNARGKHIKRQFSIKGGSISLFEGKRIGRVQNLENLGKEIENLRSQQKQTDFDIHELLEEIDTLQNLSQRDFLKEKNNHIRKLKDQYSLLNTKVEQYQKFLKSTLTKKHDIKSQLDDCQKEVLVLNPKLMQTQEELSKLDLKLKDAQTSFYSLSDEVNEKSSAYNEANISFHQQQNRMMSIYKDIEFREIQLEEIDFQKNERDTKRNNIQQLIEETSQYFGITEKQLEEEYIQKKELEEGLEELEKDYHGTRNIINKIEDEIRDLRRNKELSNTIINELKDKKNVHLLEVNAIKERLSIEFSFNVDELLDMEESVEDENTLSEQVSKIKKQLDDFGAINPLAMEAYQEMEERHQFIEKERNDLIDAKNSLLKTIETIDVTAEEKFMNAFIKIRENFKTVFRSLFNEEDACDLVLSEPNNPLNSDIDIIAKPKGKKPISINQLSGGEKTLTSTALLFALYLLKPAPFCVFDEIDAPLDDTNIDKFNNIIRQFSNESQFIIVSHNKRTIASTDIIYGVTMVEPGISRVVAVDMREAPALVDTIG